MLRAFQFAIGLVLLIGVEILRVYYIMPFPGSQISDNIELAYFLHNNMFWLRTIGILIIFFPMVQFYTAGSTASKWIVSIALGLYLYIFMIFNYKMQADQMFYQPKIKTFAGKSDNVVSEKKLVLGVTINGEAKAYPIEVIGYHHQVRDTIGTKPVMITYCTVCRSGRVYSPIVNGKPETFRLVGMDHFNAMFEDKTTGSWWRQVSGEAVAGPLKGTELQEIPSEQMSLSAWLSQHPQSKILQPDTTYNIEYESLDEYDEGTIESGLEKSDFASWEQKSWVVGVQIGTIARAYDWNYLLEKKIVNDTLHGTPIAISLENDSVSFHVWERDTLAFAFDTTTNRLYDMQTKSQWDWSGACASGKLQGAKLKRIQSYQEFWHSWSTFRPHSSKYPVQK
jgi:hypothetical protein